MFKLQAIFLSLIGIIIFLSCSRKMGVKNGVQSTIILDRQEVNLAFGWEEKVRAWQIVYKVDSLKIGGYICIPQKIDDSSKLPVIIYNRGGNGNYGTIETYQFDYLCYLASKGYAVFASQYRGNKYSEGQDSFGGEDLNDVLTLIEVAKEEHYVDADRIGMIGFSRGGMMTYQVARLSNEIKAIAVIGAPTNQFQSSIDRPRLYSRVLKPLVGDSVNYREEYINRSAVFWANQIDEPTLILHGENDSRVNVLQADELVKAMRSSNKEVNYHVFIGGDHSLRNTVEIENQRDSLVFDWFDRYLK